ncbi:MAG: pyridoxamine 5'-phosphate oxidase family protein [Candidatus Nitrosoabyssus spongiisocia]|nr:MAG: pyridoxamine 5'-phosphate oxidase family protein [Nitrosopumilaceae archaeon AB1(1)]
MVVISKDIKEFILHQRLGFVASISENNHPCISPRGTIIPWRKDKLVFADIKSPRTSHNLMNGGMVEICIIDPLLRRGYRFIGNAKLLDKTSLEYENLLSEYKIMGIKSSINDIIITSVDVIEPIHSPLYDIGISEDVIKNIWKKHYLDD